MNLRTPRGAFSLLLCSSLLAQDPRVGQDAPPATAERAQAPVDPQLRIKDQLGVQFAVVTSKLRRAMIRTTTPYGFSVQKVTKDSVADQAGITPGTIVLTVDGTPLREVADLEAVLAKAAPGQKLVLKCSRHKKPFVLADRHPWEDFEVTLVLPAKRGKSV